MAHDRKFWERWNDDLTDLVGCGDCAEVRAFFDRAFWEGREPAASWEHLKIALKAENRPMLKLLAAWGAVATDEALARLKASAPDKFLHYLRLLRASGLSLPAAPENPPAEEKPAAAFNMNLIPQEWKRLLEAFQKLWEQDAVIAGPCLSHIFNDKAARSVEIFLPHSHGNEKTKRKLLALIFRKAGLEVTEQITRPFPNTGAPEAFPAPETGKILFTDKDGYASRAETWTVIAGPQKTAYRITFANGVAAVFTYPETFGDRMRESFAFGLCQVSFDGEKVETTPAYDLDVKNKQITLVKKAGASAGDLRQLAKKYPDWKLCSESKKLLPPSGWGGALGCYPM